MFISLPERPDLDHAIHPGLVAGQLNQAALLEVVGPTIAHVADDHRSASNVNDRRLERWWRPQLGACSRRVGARSRSRLDAGRRHARPTAEK